MKEIVLYLLIIYGKSPQPPVVVGHYPILVCTSMRSHINQTTQRFRDNALAVDSWADCVPEKSNYDK